MSRFSIRPVPAFTPYAIVSVVYIVALATDLNALAGVVKWFLIPSLMLAVVLLALGAGTRTVPGRSSIALLGGGLVLSWLGDVTFANFVVGLAFFLAAQLCYIALFWVGFHRRVSWWGLLAIPWYVGFLAVLWPYLGHLLPAVVAYGLVLGVMAVSATRGNRYTVLGGLFFVASDSLLAIQLFTPAFQGGPANAVIMTLYVLAQGFIVGGTLLAGREPDAQPAPSID